MIEIKDLGWDDKIIHMDYEYTCEFLGICYEIYIGKQGSDENIVSLSISCNRKFGYRFLKGQELLNKKCKELDLPFSFSFKE